MKINSLDEEGKNRGEVVKSVSDGEMQMLEAGQKHVDGKGVPELPL